MNNKSSKIAHKGLSVACAILMTLAFMPSIASADGTSSSSDVSQSTDMSQSADVSQTADDTSSGTSISQTTEATDASVTADTQSYDTDSATAAADTSVSTTLQTDSESETSQASEPAVTTQGAADVALTMTTDQTSYANGEYASFKVHYVLDYGKVQPGDTITITVPDVLKNVNVAFSSLHFSACNNLGNGTYQLVFNDSAPEGLSGYFSINAFTTNTTASTKTGTVSVGDQSVAISVTPTPGDEGPGVETRAIEKWAPDGTGYTQTTATTGVYEDGANVRFAFEADPRCSAMQNVIVTDTLPDELQFVPGSIVIEKTSKDRTSTETLTAAQAAQFIKSQGQNLEFDFGDMDGSYYYRVYYNATVVAGTNVKLTNTAHVNYDNGSVEASTFTLKPANDAGAAVGYKKVDKTVISEDPADQIVTYTITFTNDNAFAKDSINLSDVLDTPDGVKYVTAYGSSYFSVSYDEDSHAVLIDNTTEIPASMTQTVTIVTDFSNVQAGKTISNTVGGNTVKTKKVASGKLNLTASKTVGGVAPAVSEVFSFVLKDSTGTTLQTKQNAGSSIDFDTIYYSKDDIGKTFTYTVSESGTTPNYISDASVYTVSVTPTQDADGNIVVTPTITKDGTAVSSISFDNKVETVSKSVTKTWSDSNNQDGHRPSSIQVQLYANGSTYGDPITLNTDNGWTYTWNNLPKISSGNLVDYTVAEVQTPDGYTETVIDDGNTDAFAIVNSHTPVPIASTFDISFQKLDASTGSPLSGCKLNVTSADGSVVYDTWTTDASSAHTVILVAGSYLVNELEAPEGYSISNPIAFTIATDGTVTSSGLVNGVVTVNDTKTPTTPQSTTPESPTPSTPSTNTPTTTVSTSTTSIVSNTGTASSNTIPKTADSSEPMLILAILLACFGAIVVCAMVVKRRRRME